MRFFTLPLFVLSFALLLFPGVSEAQISNYETPEYAGPSARMAFPTPDHFAPLLYVLGAADAKDSLKVFNDARVLGSLSMTSYLFS